jgi:hypothetical protein
MYDQDYQDRATMAVDDFKEEIFDDLTQANDFSEHLVMQLVMLIDRVPQMTPHINAILHSAEEVLAYIQSIKKRI